MGRIAVEPAEIAVENAPDRPGHCSIVFLEIWQASQMWRQVYALYDFPRSMPMIHVADGLIMHKLNRIPVICQGTRRGTFNPAEDQKEFIVFSQGTIIAR